MDDAQLARRKKSLQVIGLLFIVVGLIGLCLTSFVLLTDNTADAGYSFIVLILTLVTGILLLCFKQNKARDLILLLRVFFLLDIFAMISGLVYRQLTAVVCPTVLLVLLILAMVILSRERISLLPASNNNS